MKIPSVREYVIAFTETLDTLSEREIQMLRIHFTSPDHTTTAEILSEAMGYENFGGANLQYGLLAGKLCNHFRLKPTFKLEILCNFVPPFEDGDNVHWLWIMRREVVEALERLGWCGHSGIDKTRLIDSLSEIAATSDETALRALRHYWADDNSEPAWLARIVSSGDQFERLAATTVAKLFAFNPSSSDEQLNFGGSARRLLKELSPKGDPYGLEKRFRTLFRMNLEDEILVHDLTWFIRMFLKYSIPVNWSVLLDDLRFWSRSSRSIQKEWATEFWANRSAQI